MCIFVMLQAIAEGAEEVTPLQPAAESKPEEKAEGAEKDVVSTLKKSQDAAAEREAGEQVLTCPTILKEILMRLHSS